jgi:hypothetical protein
MRADMEDRGVKANRRFDPRRVIKRKNFAHRLTAEKSFCSVRRAFSRNTPETDPVGI